MIDLDFKKRLLFYVLVISFFWVGRVAPAHGQENSKPNVLLILVDDLGYHDLSITGSDFYETPNIDKLGEQSFRFEQGYASSRVCSPSRAGLMTGVTPAVHGITDWIGAPEGASWRKYGRHTQLLPPSYVHSLPADMVTLPEAMKANGYETFFAGKWHLGGAGSYPEDHGFDTNVGGYESGSPKGGYYAPYDNPKLSQGPNGENLSIRLAEETATFIEQAHERPFFAMLSFYAVHGPIQTTSEKWAKYRNKAESAGIADHGYAMERRLPIRQVQDNPVYGGLVETMDEAVGIVTKALEAQGLDENTIVIFTSDHGGVASGDNFSTSNLPLRGGKGYQWEGGLRVPFFIKVPGTAGGTIEDPASNIDFLPTLVELTGGDMDSLQGVEGVSLVPAMEGKRVKSRDFYWHYPHYGNQGGDPSAIIRSGEWKLIYYWENKQAELYNLSTDPYEQQDMAPSQRKLVKKLTQKLLGYLESHQANYPYPDPDYTATKEAEVLKRSRTERLRRLETEREDMLTPGWQPNADWWGSKVTKD
ncbi:sulfatase [Echinicola strongylocentroti]|uniref:Sulfatase n=1 Tax=Echinicola strongylocentroti TaxID=1795355 RepID=A0A2Z4IEY0_9BACT|nr:sulfatase [Echinicola strongylocentroti]AWW29226.1 sulfatase [Echinicola strongylocentroti]